MKPDADICINAYLVQEGVAVSTGVNSTVVTFHRVQNSKKLTALQGLCTERDQEKLNDAPSDVAAKLTKKTKKKTTEKKKKEGNGGDHYFRTYQSVFFSQVYESYPSSHQLKV